MVLPRIVQCPTFVFTINDTAKLTQKSIQIQNRNKKMKVERKRRSVRLEPDLKKAFRRYVKSFDTILDCAEDLEVHFNTVPNILRKGTCSPEVKARIIEKTQTAA